MRPRAGAIIVRRNDCPSTCVEMSNDAGSDAVRAPAGESMGTIDYPVWIEASPSLGLLGKLVEAAILSPREGQKELARLKRLIESNPGVHNSS
jgi:hypothetical protein